MARNDLSGRGFNDWNKNVDNFDYNKRANEIDGEYIKPKERKTNETNFGELNNKTDEKFNNANKIVIAPQNNEITRNNNEQVSQESSNDNYKKSKYEEIAEQIIADLQNKNNEALSESESSKELGAGLMKKRKSDFPMLITIFVAHCILFGLAIMLFFIKLNASAAGKALISNFFSIFLVLVYAALFIVELFLMLRCQKRAGKVLFFVSMALIFPTIGILIP